MKIKVGDKVRLKDDGAIFKITNIETTVNYIDNIIVSSKPQIQIGDQWYSTKTFLEMYKELEKNNE